MGVATVKSADEPGALAIRHFSDVKLVIEPNDVVDVIRDWRVGTCMVCLVQHISKTFQALQQVLCCTAQLMVWCSLLLPLGDST